ncbi:unnamed protein product [Porites evermanni]|uniref:Uncharacterized protein n=1 Tax=Porites evermanni TaxID=104178 RepID=A0ABN8M1C9_9CNID|nr:unnamed protein product [Porites evermanni]
MAEGSSTGESLARCAPERDVFVRLSVKTSSKLLSNFNESLKTQDNKDDEDRANNMCLESLAPGTVNSIVDSRGLFLTWHNHAYPGKTVTLPLSETEIKKFFVSCARAGFTYTRLTNNIIRGICMWVTILPNRDPPRETKGELMIYRFKGYHSFTACQQAVLQGQRVWQRHTYGKKLKNSDKNWASARILLGRD